MSSIRQASAVSTAQLLGRPEKVVYGDEAKQLIQGNAVLVTGAGGSIGSELVRQLTQLGAGVVHLLDHDEGRLHALQLELTGNGLLNNDTSILTDIRDQQALTRVFRTLQPSIVFHAAANKHLPLLERYPREGVNTNVFGSRNVAIAAAEAGVERLINVSTDKAARPTSILGVTKRLAEDLTASTATDGRRVASVRFGNVLGSRGSFLESLAWQIHNSRPVTVTDKRVSRFFMTIPEAAGLVIEAAVMADAGETYVLDMGEPVRILDLVDRYVDLTQVASPEVIFTGLRPGEKLHEELYDSSEILEPTAHARISKVRRRQQPSAESQSLVVQWLRMLAADGSDEQLRRALFDWAESGDVIRLPEARPLPVAS
jgi:FlaA1/EpsC-like NDP-sugar epimerase